MQSILFILFLSFLYPNTVDTMIDGIISGQNQFSNDEILLKIDNMNLNDDSNVLILKGLVEPDGYKSYNYFKNYFDRDDNSKYRELAISKISGYHYTSGLYVKSSQWYKKLIIDYPNSKDLEPNINYFLNSLSIAGKLDSAKFYSKLLHEKHPNLKFNPKFYSNGDVKNKKKTRIGVNYSVEVSLYETYSKAASIKSALSSEGFVARIDELLINEKKMYALRVGSYKNKKAAENIKKRIRSRLGLSNLIVIEI
jgi:hypothetical protein